MESTSTLKSGRPIALQDLRSSDLYKHGASIRVTGRLQSYNVETALAVIIDEAVSLEIDTQHLTGVSFRLGCLYQFIGELIISPDADVTLMARVGRNVDGMDLQLYRQSLLLLRQFVTELSGPRPAS